MITKVYFLEISGFNNATHKFKSIDKKLQFTDQEKNFLRHYLTEEVSYLTRFKTHFYQTTNLLMLRTHNLLTTTDELNGQDLKIDLS